METTTTFVVLSYLGPTLGIIGFIITPGLTVILPWLKEKFNKDKQKQIGIDLNRKYENMDVFELDVSRKEFIKKYKWDWRYKVIKKRKELRNLIKNTLNKD